MSVKRGKFSRRVKRQRGLKSERLDSMYAKANICKVDPMTRTLTNNYDKTGKKKVDSGLLGMDLFFK